jgi:hypothetical protein
MPPRLLLLRRPAILGVAAAVLLSVLAVPAAGASTGKQFVLTVVPTSVAAGVEVPTASVTLKNEAATQQLGSADVTAPAGFAVSEPSIAGRPALGVSGRTIQLRNLSLAPGGSVTVTFKLRAPCQPPASSLWTVVAKQANDFNGTGNDFALKAGSANGTAVDGACSLGWVTEPEDAEAGDVITGVRYQPTGSAVKVAVLDGRGSPIPTATGGVALRFGLQGGFGSLSGGTSTLAGAGGAAFANLRISAIGTYTLVASVTSGSYQGLTTVASGRFRLDRFVEQCVENVTCTQPVDSGPTTLSVSALAADDRPFLTLSLDAGIKLEPKHCGRWQGYSPGTALFNVTRDPDASTSRAKRVSLTVAKDVMNSDPENGAPRLELCLGSPEPFYAKGSTTLTAPSGLVFDWDTDGDDDPVYTGLLPDCPRGGHPCVTQRKKVGAGQGFIEASLPSSLGDPLMRG